MTKRSRGTSRPGQRRPISRPATRPATAAMGRALSDAAVAPVRPGSLTPDEEARAAQLEEQIRAEERAAETAERQARSRARAAEVTGGVRREAAPLHVKAAAEYAYVRRDINRILRMAAVLIAILAVLHILINVARVITV